MLSIVEQCSGGDVDGPAKSDEGKAIGAGGGVARGKDGLLDVINRKVWQGASDVGTDVFVQVGVYCAGTSRGIGSWAAPQLTVVSSDDAA